MLGNVICFSGEKESLTDTNKQCQLVVSQTQSSNVELNGRIIALQKTIDALKISNDEVICSTSIVAILILILSIILYMTYQTCIFIT